MDYRKTKFYFGKAFGPDMETKFYQGTRLFDFSAYQCKLLGIRKFFDAEWVECSQYEAVTSGEGNEKEKIDSAFSSSLQSLLFFAQAPNKGITIPFEDGDRTFNKVIFEYKNKVIGYPSSVDVVLYDDTGDSICFVESKLLEIVRDSNKEGKAEVGISYFAKKGVGYCETLGLAVSDLKNLGMTVPTEEFLDVVKGSGFSNQFIKPLSGNTYVYSYGIKQVLSHLIGIVAFLKGESAYDAGDPLPLKMRSFKKCYYLQLYNELPDFDGDKDAKTKLENFETHFKAVTKTVMDKMPKKKDKPSIDHIEIMTYQKLFEKNEQRGLISDVSRDYYHLKDK